MDRKIKVVLLCHYWSDDMAEMVGRKHYFRELSPWIQETLNLFKNRDEIEYHVVAPNYASNKTVNCQKDGIQFHFYHYAPSFLSVVLMPLFKTIYKHDEPYKMAERLANVITGYQVPANSAARIIRKIDPDLVHLYGSEVSDHGFAGVRLLGSFPILLTVQGWAYLQEKSRNPLERLFQLYREYCERKINKSVRFMTYSTPKTPEEMRNENNVGFFSKVEKVYHVRAITKIPQINALLVDKKYDVVFYARITRDKGIEDLINSFELLRKKGRLLSAVIMGKGNNVYIDEIKETIRQKGLEKQINIIGYVESHDEVYNMAAQARLLVLPTHNDGIPNTIREAMFMKLPVVANNVGGIPRFNQNRHCIHMVECGDINSLAEGICRILDDDKYREELINNAFLEANDLYSPNVVYDQTVSAYKDVVNRLNQSKQ